MPIHFRCPTCQRKLSVGSHKAGSDAQCPKCGATIKIPTREEVAALAAMAAASPVDDGPADFANFQFIDELLEVDRTTGATPLRESFHPDYVAVRRGALYAQGALIVGMTLLGFLVGYLIGSSGAPTTATNPAAQPGALVLQGQLSFRNATGAKTGDGGAVIILLPQGDAPDEKIPTAGLRPDQQPEGDNSIRAIESLGGKYVRSDVNGNFQFTVAKPGKYYVLRVSKNAARPAGTAPHDRDLESLARFFDPPTDVLGPQKYTWAALDLSQGTKLAYDFGASGE